MFIIYLLQNNMFNLIGFFKFQKRIYFYKVGFNCNCNYKHGQIAVRKIYTKSHQQF